MNAHDALDIEPLDLPDEVEPEDDAPAPRPGPVLVAAPEPLAIAEVLPADFPLPSLVRWVPNAVLRRELQDVTTYALSLEVVGPEGLQAADVALATVRAKAKAVEQHFEEPATLANQLHKAITSRRAEWLKDAQDAVITVGRRVATEQRRLDALAAEQRRRDQAEADRIAREAAQKAAEAAAKQGAPAPVVEQMKTTAATVTAPPVPVAQPAPVLAHSTVTKTWKARIAGTPADADPNPGTADMTGEQKAQVYALLKAIIDGRQPIALIDLNWSALNARAKAEKGTLAIPGIEAYEDISTRSKPGRRV